MRKRNSENGIFESVEFLNEGIVGATLLGGLLLAGGVCATVSIIKDAISDSKDKKMIKAALKNAKETNEEVAKLDERIKAIRSFSREKFLEQDFVKDEDKYKLKAAPVAIYCAVDKDDKIIAYAIYDGKVGACLFNTVESGIKPEVAEYLKALFEYKMGFKGDATKKFLKITNFNRPYGYLGKDGPKTTAASYDDLTDEERSKLKEDLKKLSTDFISFMKSKMAGYRIETDDYAGEDSISIHIYDKDEPISHNGVVKNQKAYDAYWASDGPNKFDQKATEAFEAFCKKYNLQLGKNDKAMGNKDNYPYIIIARDDNPDDFLTADFDIYTAFHSYL